jgi:hypothetical protein
MADDVQQDVGATNGAHVPGLLAAFRHIGLPLMQALAEARGASGGERPVTGFDENLYGGLIDSTVTLCRELGAQLDGKDDQLDAAVRWALAGSASQVVAANYRATGHALPTDEAKRLAALAATLQSKFKGQIPPEGEKAPNTVATFRARMMEAMVPVIGAVAQYAFGRAEHALLAEVAEQLVKAADQITRSLAPAGATPEQWRLLCWNILRASGQIYAECHYAEADRLLYMSPEDRAALFAKHDNIIPMTQVWQSFRQRMAMLATLAMYLDVPQSAQLEAQSWL